MIKQSDIALIILVSGLSLVASFVIGNAVINTDKNRTAQIEVVTAITSNFSEPSNKIFNENAINPTELIQIGENQVDKPFPETQDAN